MIKSGHYWKCAISNGNYGMCWEFLYYLMVDLSHNVRCEGFESERKPGSTEYCQAVMSLPHLTSFKIPLFGSREVLQIQTS